MKNYTMYAKRLFLIKTEKCLELKKKLLSAVLNRHWCHYCTNSYKVVLAERKLNSKHKKFGLPSFDTILTRLEAVHVCRI